MNSIKIIKINWRVMKNKLDRYTICLGILYINSLFIDARDCRPNNNWCDIA